MATLLAYKCPCCNGKIEFDSESQRMKCPFCDTEFDVETLKHYDEDLKTDSQDDLRWEKEAGSGWQDGEADGLNVYVCNSCGGEIVADDTTAATHCPFCGNPVVMTGKLSGALRPDYVIPFKLDKKAAKDALKRHFSGKKLLPKVFADENHIDEIKGVYVPFWLFDATANANVRFKCTRVRRWSDSRYHYTETNHFSAVRAGSLSFAHVPVDGSTKMADDLMESIEPYDFSEAVDFQTAYLSGYFADKYDVTAEDSVSRANARIKRSTEEALSDTVRGYTTVLLESSSMSLSESSAKYALYPVWLLATSWRDQNYLFAMNGQTGKMVGDLPMDKSAFWRYFFQTLVIAGGVTLGLLSLLHFVV
ncbi:MAG: hypothetical protein IJ493_03680 [Clostridia bacterium]|nr:hypothetical protein [Clostridia bacterium]